MMTFKLISPLVLVALAACSTSPSTSSGTTTYHPIGSAGIGTNSFTGKGIKITYPRPNQVSIVSGSGSQNRATRSITVQTDGYSMTDPDGADSNDQATNSAGDFVTLRLD